MARVYVDANVLIDMFGVRALGMEKMLVDCETVVSVLSIHILAYVLRWKIPSSQLARFSEDVEIVEFSRDIMQKATGGPTDDFEDNIQLHSAVAGDCDVFLTSDRRLLRLGYFGKVRISNRMSRD